jgi:hypothetical protein
MNLFIEADMESISLLIGVLDCILMAGLLDQLLKLGTHGLLYSKSLSMVC